MLEARRRTDLPGRPQPPPVATRGGSLRFPEPPALRGAALGSARLCTNCATPVSFPKSPPLCWGCGRTLCVDCYWRHGLTPSAHTCAACLARGVTGATARSGARSTNGKSTLNRSPASV